MLQISQTENPMCSATIDQMRLRRAIDLPLEFQNASSSGFQSEIQVGSFELIRKFLFDRRAGWRAWERVLERRGRALSVGTGQFVSTNGFDDVAQGYSSFVPTRFDAEAIVPTISCVEGDRGDQARTHRKFAFAQFLCDAQSVGRSDSKMFKQSPPLA